MNAPVRPGALSAGALPIALAEPAIRFEKVGKTYAARSGQQAVSALAGIDLSVPTGSILGVIGRSGAGKSTLIRLVNGLERATDGRILIHGEDVTKLTDPAGVRRTRARSS
ncbi:ABC transporter domain-containing protein OS=Bosea thiooxidans OX=53254 GN=ARD30_08060 PE=3 SV=1 [Bosea thiooxidans]